MWIEPAVRMTSRVAEMLRAPLSAAISIPFARSPSNNTQVTFVLSRSVRFARPRFGCRKAVAALTRVPSRAMFMLM